MPDEPHDVEIRARLDDLAGPVDVEAAWSEMTRRFDRDRWFRSMRVLATAAAVVVVLVAAGIGVNARRSTDPSLDVADVPSEQPAPSAAAPELVVVCDGVTGSVVTPVVAYGPEGVPIAPVQGGGIAVLVPLDGQPGPLGLGSGRDPGSSSPLFPGRFDIRCGPAVPVSDEDMTVGTASIGTLEVIDPDGNHTPAPAGSSYDCASDRYETYESADQSIEELVAWRLGSGIVIEANGAMDNTFEAVGVSGWGNVYYDGRTTVTFRFCGDGPQALPAGDGLAPSDPLRTDADAIAWLTLARDSGDANARIPKGLPAPPGTAVTITSQEAKLVRQDETAMESQGRSMAPGFAVWFLRVGYVSDDGVERFLVFAFSPAGDPRTLGADGDEPPPPGREWSSWFDALPDHAS